MKQGHDRSAVLTDEQQAVVDLPAETLLVVTAGAGAGKTHTMVRRVARLLAEEDLRVHEVLVLSFARSAVRELRERLGATGQAGRLVPVRTFDSWALDLLVEFDNDREWYREPFDERIAAAVARIRTGAADERLGEVRHLVVDEAQDLVGVRLELVQAVIEHSDCDFTVVGDAAQSIYGFQIEDSEERARGADACFRWLRMRFGDELTELELTRNFRARTDEARTALPFGPELRESAEAVRSGSGGRYESLRTSLKGALYLGELNDDLVRRELREARGTTAILCRTNGEALVASGLLAGGEVPHRVQRTVQERVAPAWLAGLFREHTGTVLTRAAYEALTDRLGLPGHHGPDIVWGLLVRSAGDRGRRSVDMDRLRRLVAERRLPDEITAQPPSALVVSTFHRAKGLEFDQVVVVDPGSLREDGDTPEDEEARLLYVAMTRPRDDLRWADPLRTWKVRRDGRVGRYARFGRKNWQRFGLEIGGEDVHPTDPAGTVGFRAGVHDLQERMMSDMAPGDPVVLERLTPSAVEDGMSPPYVITRHDLPIGVASETFRRSMFRVLGGRKAYQPKKYPRYLFDVRIDAIETVTGSVASGAIAGIGDQGMWLAPRLTGLSLFRYDGKGDDA